VAKIIVCKACGELKPHEAHGLCRVCYDHQRREAHAGKLVICKACGEEKPHYAKGLCRQCYNHQHYEANRKEILAQKQQYYEANRKEILAQKQQYYEANRKEILAQKQQYNAEHREERSAYKQRHREANPEKHRENEHRRRARKNGATIGPVDEAAVYELYGHRCIYCGATEDLTLDHVIPLAAGGAHSEDNLVVACRSCNASKNARPLEEWLETWPGAIAWVM
jgi:5-methylcytosine-specific restriction endonuclease McrA